MTKQKLRDHLSHKKDNLEDSHFIMPNNFFNREISWLKFNQRVLEVAFDDKTPSLERLKFCQIYVNNLDEFYMKRVGGLKDQIESGKSSFSIDHKTPKEQLALISEEVDKQISFLSEQFSKIIVPELKEAGIFFHTWDDLSNDQRKWLKDYFVESLYPILTPLAVDSSHPFPFLSNLSKSFAVRMHRPFDKEVIFGRVKIPDKVPQWVSLPDFAEDEYHFVNVEQVIAHNIDSLFSGMEIEDIALFRVTRSSMWDEDDEDAEDLLEFVEEGIKERRFSPIIRLEITENENSWIKSFLMQHTHLDESDIYPMPSIVNCTNFWQLYALDFPKLKFPEWNDRVPENFNLETSNIFNSIKQEDCLVHHPYENFTATVEKFISQASIDPDVMGIKITLYRTSSDSQIIKSLIRAAEEGKQVACVIELKARFDEKRNIDWANKLAKAGVHVAHGVVGLKTHTKVALVVRKEGNKIVQYAHIGTGNYNNETAKLYTDVSYFTCKKSVTNEVLEAFNFLTGYSLKVDYKQLLIAPINMRQRFIEAIKKETSFGKNGRIIAKMNQLEDRQIIEALYRASCAGVSIDLIIRGFCCLRPRVKDLSENIRVHSIIGPYLEHSRIFFFGNGVDGYQKGNFYIGSADWMYRNLSNRVEIITPIDEVKLKEKLWHVLQVHLIDNRLHWDCDNQGNYIRVSKNGEKVHCQELLFKSDLPLNLVKGF